MSVAEWAAVVAAGAAVTLVIIAGVVAVSLRRTLDEVRKTVIDVRQTVDNVNPLVKEISSLVVSVETVLKTPGVKAAALASGLGRGVQHLREKLH
jgi:hypothetical protein